MFCDLTRISSVVLKCFDFQRFDEFFWKETGNETYCSKILSSRSKSDKKSKQSKFSSNFLVSNVCIHFLSRFMSKSLKEIETSKLQNCRIGLNIFGTNTYFCLLGWGELRAPAGNFKKPLAHTPSEIVDFEINKQEGGISERRPSSTPTSSSSLPHPSWHIENHEFFRFEIELSHFSRHRWLRWICQFAQSGNASYFTLFLTFNNMNFQFLRSIVSLLKKALNSR